MRMAIAQLSVLCLLVTAPACSAGERKLTRVDEYNAALRAACPKGVIINVDSRYVLKPAGEPGQLALGAGDRLGVRMRDAYLAQKAGGEEVRAAAVVVHSDD